MLAQDPACEDIFAERFLPKARWLNTCYSAVSCANTGFFTAPEQSQLVLQMYNMYSNATASQMPSKQLVKVT